MGSTRKKNIVGDTTYFGANWLSIYGVDTLLKRIEKTLGDYQEPLARAYKAAIKPSIKDVENFMSQHHRTGKTESAFIPGHTEWLSDDFLTVEFGFDVKKNHNAGLPALFLEYGTPKIKPSFFMYYSVANHEHEMSALMEDELMKILKERGLM